MLTSSFAWHVLAGERGDHLVRVHVRGRARAGLEDVDRELVVELARGDPVAGGGDPLGLLGVEEAELGVRARGRRLDPSEPAGDGGRDRLAGDRKVLDRLACFHAPELPRRDLAHAWSLVPSPRGSRKRNPPAPSWERTVHHDGAGGTRWYGRSPSIAALAAVIAGLFAVPALGPQRRPARASDRSDARGAARARPRLQGPEDRAHRPVRRRVQARHEQPLYPRAGRRARGSQRQGRHRGDPLLPVRAAAEGAVRRRRDLGQARAGHLRTLVRPAEPIRHLPQLDPPVGGRVRRDLSRQRGRDRWRAAHPLRPQLELRAHGPARDHEPDRRRQLHQHAGRAGGAGLQPRHPQVHDLRGRQRLLRHREHQERRPARRGQPQQRRPLLRAHRRRLLGRHDARARAHAQHRRRPALGPAFLRRLALHGRVGPRVLLRLARTTRR